MSSWTPSILDRIANADEIGISSHRRDGSLRPYVIIWAVVAGDAVYIRSAYGAENGWYRRAVESGTGSIRVGDEEIAVAFARADPDAQGAVDDAYLTKYAGYPSIVRGIVGAGPHSVTLRLTPVD